MNTAEKRAQLEAAGEPWPVCECHGEPKDWHHDARYKADGYFDCSIERKARLRKRRANRRASGLCVQCGADELETASMCPSCAARHRDAAWRHEQNPLRRMAKQADNRRRAARAREAEGFQATGAGLAAFAVWTGKGTN